MIGQEPVSVPLGHGLVALVDASDAERVLAKRWHAWRKPGHPDVIYAQHTYRYGPGGRKAKSATLSLHRFVMGAERGQIVDHVRGNPLDCRRENLRLVTPLENSRNVTSSKNQKRGGFKGVWLNPRSQKWQASIRIRPEGWVGAKGKQLNLGTFANAADAARAYDRAALEHFGPFASLNFADPEAEQFAIAMGEAAEVRGVALLAMASALGMGAGQ